MPQQNIFISFLINQTMALPETISNLLTGHRKSILILIIIGIFVLFLKWFQIINERLRNLK